MLNISVNNEQFLDQLAATGKYPNRDAEVNAALLLLQETAGLRELIREAEAELAIGEFTDFTPEEFNAFGEQLQEQIRGRVKADAEK